VSEIVVIADGHPDAGLGHLMRCTALGSALSLAGVELRCVALGSSTNLTIDGLLWQPRADVPDLDPGAIVVLDSYRTTPAVRMRLLDRHWLATFEDFNQDTASPRAALEIAPALTPRSDRLAGLSYACLRTAFWVQPRPSTRDTVRRILISAGGGPATATARRALAAAAAAAFPKASLRVVGPPGDLLREAEVIGPANLAGEMRAADIVVTAAGQTAIEAAACGTPTVAVAVVDNQQQQAKALREAGAVHVVDGISDVRDALQTLAPAAARADLGARGQAGVDGFGALRCARAILPATAPTAST
jgi:spore coat polysaccharide biosynthesis predicted glycosyltransferase SpsG